MKRLFLLCLIWAQVASAEGLLQRLRNGLSIIRQNNIQFSTGLRHKAANLRGLGETHVMLADCGDVPADFDLRDLGVVPPIKDQGNCGSCWAFSQTASLESAYAASGGKILNLAEQQLVSCDSGNYGCDGGLLNNFTYQIKNGQTAEENFPYRAADVRCKAALTSTAKGTSFAYVGQPNRRPTQKEVMCALYKSHTIPWITVSANGRWGSPPTSSAGVVTKCSTGQTNHAVGLVGWKTINGKVYFKVRNSWGTSWGSNADRASSERGYVMMPLGCDSLGDEVAYIVTSDVMPCVPPKVKLPMELQIAAGDEARLGIRGESGVDYTWYEGTKNIGTSDFVYVAPTVDTIYRLTAKNSCGQAESSVRVRIMP